MTKADVVEQIRKAAKNDMTQRQCQRVVDELLEAMTDGLAQGERIELRGFGVFKVKRRSPRIARNPRTGEPVSVAERSRPAFKPSRMLREEVTKNGRSSTR